MKELSIDEQFLLTGNDFTRSKSYWESYLQQHPIGETVSLFETGKLRATSTTFVFTLDSSVRHQLMNLCKHNHLSVYIYVLTAYTILVNKYTQGAQPGIGSPLFAENYAALTYDYNELIPLIGKVNGETSFKDLLLQMKRIVVEAATHQHYPLLQVVDQEDRTSLERIFNTVLVCDSLHKKDGFSRANRAMVIALQINGHSLSFEVNSQAGLFFPLEQLFHHLEYIIRSSLHNIQIPVSELKVINAAEEKVLLEELNATTSTYPKEKTIPELFAVQVAKTPGALALLAPEQTMSYEQLDQTSNQVANYLLGKGVRPGDKIGLLATRGVSMIEGMLGILKAGAIYIPINTSYPPERIRYIIQDAGITTVLCTDSGLAHNAGLQPVQCLSIGESVQEATTSLQIPSNAEDGVYIMYTSGTTGNPKGILVNHRNIVKLVYDAGVIRVQPADRVLQWSNYAFDGSTYEIYSALLQGAGVCLIPENAASDVDALSEIIEQQNVTIVFITTALFNSFIDHRLSSLKGVRKLLFGGEMCSPKHVQQGLQALGPGKIIHVYGPTETTVYATSYQVDHIDERGIIPIGKPLSNTQMRILDAGRQLVPPGAIGELYIGGDGVAMGYINNEILSTEKFVTVNGTDRWYRSGDFARWLPDGNIDLLGRIDGQVKIRGYRIELGEIEAVLREYPGVTQCVVIVHTDGSGNKRLIGYLVAASDLSKEEVIHYVQSKLPDYMVPSVLIYIDQLPLNSNGKIDRRQLPDPDLETNLQKAYQPPVTPLQKQLALIWQELLGIERIGIEDNFFELGGHSLLAIQLIAAIRKELGQEVAIKNIFDCPTIAELANQMGQQQTTSLLPRLEHHAGEDQAPLSFAQERLWFIDKLQGSIAYHMPWVFRLTGDLNISALEAAFGAITDRHELLRTVIREDDGIGYQQVMPTGQWHLQQQDMEAITRQGSNLSAFIETFIQQPYNLSQDPVLRVLLIRLSAQEYRLLIVLHHIAFDGWSIAVMVRELVEGYRAWQENRSINLPPLPVQYADYARWQKGYLSGPVLEEKCSYWKAQLDHITPLTLLTDHARSAEQSFSGGVVHKLLSPSLLTALKTLSTREGATLFMTLLSVYKVLLYRYTAQEDICVGSPIAGRQLQETEDLIGFFVNTLALRSTVRGSQSFIELLQQVKQTTLDAYQHQELPFEKVVEALGVERNLSSTPVFQVMFVLQNMPESEALDLGGVFLQSEDAGIINSKFDLNLTISESPEGLELALVYCSDLFNSVTIERMLGHYENLLQAIVAGSNTSIATLPMLTPEETQEVLVTFNNTESPFPRHATILSLFEEQATESPDAVALVAGDERVTYKVLNERANQLGHYLQSLGVREETPVPLCLNRGIDMIVAILGVMKAGGAYLPIDPKYPANRINFIVADSNAGIVITTAALAGLFNNKEQQLVLLDTDREKISAIPTIATQHALQAGNLAYIIYTSGSTGQPKGVLTEHRSLVNYIQHQSRFFGIQPADRVLQFSNYCFDPSVEQIFLALCNGAALVLFEEGLQFETERFEQFLLEQRISHLHATPGFLNTLRPGTYGGLKRVVAGGEICSPQLAAQWSRLVNFYNKYGPTETTISVLEYPVNVSIHHDLLPVGKPLANTIAYIIDQYDQPVPVGVAGELCIGGIPVARGYLNRPVLMAQKFVPDPFSSRPGARMYRTGDQARWLPDGNISFVGRADEQVKIRGYRIELGEVEKILHQAAGVKQCAVLVKENKKGIKQLIAYIVTDRLFSQEAVQHDLNALLPDYMVPSVLVELDELPLTYNGKLDKKRLLAMETVYQPVDSREAPRNELEEKLALTWQELLGVEQLSIHDNFFERGGDSIITIQVVSRMKRWGYSLTPRDLFLHQTIATLAMAIGSRQGMERTTTAEQGLLQGESGLLPIQQSWFQQAGKAESHYNQSVLLSIDKQVGAPMLQQVLQQLMQHHDALRFSYQQLNTGWQQVYGDHIPMLISEDLRAIAPANLPAAITLCGNKYQRSLDIEKGELVKMVLIQTPGSESHNRLLIVVHHLAIDGVSWRILLEDLDRLLSASMKHEKVSLGNKTNSYREWHQALVKYSEQKQLQQQQTYWEKQVTGFCPLPVDKAPDQPCAMKHMQTFSVKLGLMETRALLQTAPAAYHTVINDLLLCSLVKVLSFWSGSERVTIGLEGHGREELVKGMDLSRTIGWFTNLYPVLLEMPDDGDTGSLVKSIKEQLRQVPDKGMGYGILKYLTRSESLQGKQPWDIVFNYLGQTDQLIGNSQWLRGASESAGDTINENWAQIGKLGVNSIISGGELIITWNYSALHYETTTIETLARQYLQQLEAVIHHCIQQLQTAPVFTPADFGLSAAISYQELDIFLEAAINGSTRKEWVESMYGLSGLQEGILFQSLYDQQGGAYMQQMCGEISGLQMEAFQKSWTALLKHHSILRTGFYPAGFSIPVQVVCRQVKMPIEILDYRHLDAADQRQQIQEFEAADLRKGFNLNEAPLMRITLIQLTDQRYKMIWTTHHLVMDGWSVPVLIEEFLQTYDTLVAGKDGEVEAIDNFEDYIRFLNQRDAGQEDQYWRKYLRGLTAGTRLPFIRPNAGNTRGVSAWKEKTLLLDAGVTAQLTAFAQQQHLTINTLMQGVWAFLLHRYNDSSNIAFGVTVAGRPEELALMEQRVGTYINTIPLHSEIQEDQSPVAWLQSIQQDQLLSREYQYIPLSRLQSFTGLADELFDTMMIFQNFPVNQVFALRQWQLQVEQVQVNEQTTNYPLTIRIITGLETTIQFIYKEALLEAQQVAAICGHFEQVLLQFISNTAQRLGDLRLLTASEEQLLLNTFNDTATAYPTDKTVIGLFEEQVLRSPEAIAVEFEGKEMTYRQLDEQAAQLGQYLRTKGVQPETLVPVCLDRSLDMIIAILGIWKAGGAYLPVDPDYPPSRIDFMLSDTNAQFVITHNTYKALFHSLKSNRIILLDIDRERIQLSAAKEKRYDLQPHHLAYIIYTSGSTGQPKGVMNEQGGLVNRLLWTQDYFKLTPQDKILQKTTFCFDVSVWELCWPLITGARLVFAKPGGHRDNVYLKKLIEQRGITTLHFVPSMLEVFLDNIMPGDCAQVQKVLCSGEALKPALLPAFKEKLPKAALHNLYGPTEAAIDVSCWTVPSDLKTCSTVPIGKPVANTTLYIVDKKNNLLPLGATGELCIGGVQVARGYWNRPELNREKFVTDPFSVQPQARMYRTGDLARWLPDGNIEYLGRIDDQLKIRGFRVEPGEIESVLQQAPGVKQAVIVSKEDKQGSKRLVGYYVAELLLNKEELTTWLKAALPEYMVPGILIQIDTIPLNANGKADKKQLPEVELAGLVQQEYLAPRNETEEQLVLVWQQLLGLQRVGINDNFFELGGQSLLAMRMVAAIHKQTGKEISVREIFDWPTIADLAARIAAQSQTAIHSLKAGARQNGPVQLSFAQERLWFIHNLQGSVQYHMPWVFHLEGQLHPHLLESAFRDIIQRHEILHTVIREEAGIGYQQLSDPGQWQMQYIDHTAIAAAASSLDHTIETFIRHPYDLSKDPMLRVALFRLAEQEYKMVVLLHHIAFDGWSIDIMVQELTAAYRNRSTNSIDGLQKPHFQYADFASWQRAYLSDDVLEKKGAYWKKQLSGIEPMALSTDYQRPPIQSIRGGRVYKKIRPGVQQDLLALSKQEGVSLFMTLLSVFKVLLNRYTGQDDLCVGSPIAGRQHPETEKMIGLFVNTLALRSNLSDNPGFAAYLKRVRQVTLEAYEQQDLPFEKIVEVLGLGRDLSRTPVFQVMFSLQNLSVGKALDLGGAVLTAADTGHLASKFDLNLSVSESADGLHLHLTYCSDLFKEETMHRMLGHYEQLLQAVIANRDLPIAQLRMITPAEEQQLLYELNTAAVVYPQQETIVTLFEQQATSLPASIAVVFENEQLTYRELDERSNQLASYLRNCGVSKGNLVPLCLERSVDLLVAILGILKAGAAYVPVDPGQPVSRINYILEDTAATIIVCSTQTASLFNTNGTARQLVQMDTDRDRMAACSTLRIPSQADPAGLIYLIYTSGSTGTPKGVAIRHQGILDYVYGLAAKTPIHECSSFGLVSTIAADLGNTVLFSALITGGTLHILSEEAINDPQLMHAYFSNHQVDCLKIVPSHWQALSASGKWLLPERLLFFGGESLPASLIENIRISGSTCTIVNHYGPTETTIGKLLHQVQPDALYDSVIPIGKPFSNTTLYVLTKHGELCPIGVPGELFIAGDGVADGYINNPGLTADRFMRVPFSNEKNWLMYRTGDLVKYLPDGNIVFIGRTDDQVKIRGYRVELGEVNYVLQQAPGVSQSVVIAAEDQQGARYLAGYIVPNAPFNREAIKDFLQARLPAYMVPGMLIEIENIPLTPNGKVDRKRLPEAGSPQSLSNAYQAPRDPLETTLAAIWQELLGIDRVGVYDNFFELGGHSLLGMRVIAHLRHKLSIAISVHAIFQFTCINDLAKYIELERSNHAASPKADAPEMEVIDL
jgi:amino acid adenylation domain-containing protein/non-ribosomal peptide synthase protein (TIGR01720 family)